MKTKEWARIDSNLAIFLFICIFIFFFSCFSYCQTPSEKAIGYLIRKEVIKDGYNYALTYRIPLKDSAIERTINLPKEYFEEKDSLIQFWIYFNKKLRIK